MISFCFLSTYIYKINLKNVIHKRIPFVIVVIIRNEFFYLVFVVTLSRCCYFFKVVIVVFSLFIMILFFVSVLNVWSFQILFYIVRFYFQRYLCPQFIWWSNLKHKWRDQRMYICIRIYIVCVSLVSTKQTVKWHKCP